MPISSPQRITGVPGSVSRRLYANSRRREDAVPPVPPYRAITFAPSGKVVVSALSFLRKGGVVAVNVNHLDQMPAFNYDKLLWGERQIRSVANMTRDDAQGFLELARRLQFRPKVAIFSLDDAHKALNG